MQRALAALVSSEVETAEPWKGCSVEGGRCPPATDNNDSQVPPPSKKISCPWVGGGSVSMSWKKRKHDFSVWHLENWLVVVAWLNNRPFWLKAPPPIGVKVAIRFPTHPFPENRDTEVETAEPWKGCSVEGGRCPPATDNNDSQVPPPSKKISCPWVGGGSVSMS